MADDLYALIERLPRNDPAWELLDAFDAVTNGMTLESAGNAEKAKKKKDAQSWAKSWANTEFEPWALLIEAIHYLYAGEGDKCRSAAEKIADGSPPASLKPLFRAWLVRKKSGSLDAALAALSAAPPEIRALYEKLVIDPHPLTLVAGEAEEALREGLEDQFINYAQKVLSGLKEQSDASALSYAANCLRLLLEEGAGADGFIKQAEKILGENSLDALAAVFSKARADSQPDLFPGAGSFEEIAACLPPAARYLGPGVWLKAIKSFSTA